MTTPTVAIVGAGASGVLSAIHLIEAGREADRRVDLLLIDSETVGRGVAYRTLDRRHRLNVPAGRMSVWPDRPDHFVTWLVTHADPSATAATFAARCDYGRYLHDTLLAVVGDTPQCRLEIVDERVTGLTSHGRRLRMMLGESRTRSIDAAVLALGNGAPSTDWAPEELRRSARFVADPWAGGALRAIPAGQSLLIVGSGLTMADVASVLGDQARVIHTVSRHGLAPFGHAHPPVPAVAPPLIPAGPLTWPTVRRLVVRHVRAVVRAGGDWRSAIDSLRTVTNQIWVQLEPQERERFLAFGARRWDQVRHRVEPAVGDWLAEQARRGTLIAHTGEVAAAQETATGITVTLTTGQTIEVGAVLNCTGPRSDLRRDPDPLVLNLLSSGTACSGPHGFGLATDEAGRVRAADGSARRLWTLGPMRRGQLWESTAVPEIRDQAVDLAAAIVSDLPAVKIRRRPRDMYGLPLSASPEAARLYTEALGRVLRVQSGAPALLAEAVAADPTFALAHAALALLGNEWGADVDVPGSIEAALRFADTGDERERRFIQVAAERVNEPGTRSAASLIAHIQAYPEDALAVSAAVPTIAFAGATELPQEAWALVEGLAPAYGDDWWYAGMLAFVRQEQNRWHEAMQLATFALDAEPDSGHAAHARAHVHYETGDHARGLPWLDGWIMTRGPATAQRAHFSWHAALHELALGDDRAAAGRYVAQLAPPAVSGVRALVDSASLLWRGYVVEAWEWPSVAAILDSIPRSMLTDPPTPFVALHAAVALTAAEDHSGLKQLRDRAARHADPAFAGTVRDLADALLALIDGNAGVATERLLALGSTVSLAGSAAQRDVVEETLLFSALTARRHEVAERILRVRLDRRPSPRDAARLAGLVDFPMRRHRTQADARSPVTLRGR